MSYLDYPILFENSESDFATQGIGILTDCLSVKVTNEFNELPELSLSYLGSGDIANELVKDRIILADVGEGYLKQLFRIDSVKKSIDSKIEVTASHILNDLSYNTLKQNIVKQAVTPVAAFNLLKDDLEQAEPKLNMVSSISGTTSINWDMTKIDNAKKALGGATGSLLQMFKGEYLFDNYTVHYERQIGTKTGKVIEYGKDLVQVNQEENIEETYNAIKPFAKAGSGNDEKLIYLPERIIKTNSNFEKLRVLTKDFSQDKIETADQLRSRTNKYITDNKVGIPKVSLTFEIADIKDDLGFVDELKMGDEVTVYFANLNIDTTARVIKTVWDGLLHRYQTVTIGDKPKTSADYQSDNKNAIDETQKDLEESKKDTDEKLDQAEKNTDEKIKDSSEADQQFALNSANGRSKNYYGDTEPTSAQPGDMWFKGALGDGDVTMYKYEDGKWVELFPEGRDEELKAQMEQSDAETEEWIKSAGFDTAQELYKAVSDNGKSIVSVKANANGLQTQITNNATSTSSRFTQLSNLFDSKISNTQSSLSSQITQKVNSIKLSVSGSGASSYLWLNGSSVELGGRNIHINGSTYIANGSIGAAAIGTLDAGKIVTGTLRGIQLSGVSIVGTSTIDLNGGGYFTRMSAANGISTSGMLEVYGWTRLHSNVDLDGTLTVGTDVFIKGSLYVKGNKIA